MNTLLLRLPVIIGYMVLSLLLVSCSGDDDATVKPYDHAHTNTTDMAKHPFEHEFARQCVTRETANSVNKEMDRQRFAEPCMCIATYLLKDLTAIESDKFLHEKKHSQSLRIKYETAAYNCLQKKQPAEASKIFESR